MVVVAYGLILPRHILDLPRYGCLNIHASLLPRWRGAAPIQRAIEAGDRETGITIMQMDEGLDTGDMILEKRIPIGNRTDAGQLHDTLALLGAQAIVEALSRLPLSQNQVTPQDSAQATYAAKLSKAEANIDWSESASSIDAKVRALTPWPVAQTHLDNVTYRIWEALPDTTHSKEAAPGTIVESSRDGLRVSTGQGDLWIKRLQIPGGKPLTVEQHLAAHRVAEGSRFAHPTTP
jgi:methionyl-tRNA formyltransferase